MFNVSDGLSLSGNAPRIFSRTLKNGLPVFAIVASALFGSLAYMGLGSANGSAKVFGWFQNRTYRKFSQMISCLELMNFVCSDW